MLFYIIVRVKDIGEGIYYQTLRNKRNISTISGVFVFTRPFVNTPYFTASKDDICMNESKLDFQNSL